MGEDEFVRLYRRLEKYVLEQLAERDPGRPTSPLLESDVTAQYGVLGVPSEALLAIDDDREFLISAFCRILGRLPSQEDIDTIAERLELGESSRNSAIRALMASAEYRVKGARVVIVND